MALLGLLLLLTGFIMNIRILMGPYRGRLSPAEIMRTPPWLVSLGLLVVGFLLLTLGGH